MRCRIANPCELPRGARLGISGQGCSRVGNIQCILPYYASARIAIAQNIRRHDPCDLEADMRNQDPCDLEAHKARYEAITRKTYWPVSQCSVLQNGD